MLHGFQTKRRENMSRDIPVGNGTLLVCFDQDYLMRDLYFPHVGQENHLGGRFCRFGIWVNGRFSWMGKEWERDLHYEEDTLVTRVGLYHPGFALRLVCRDAVDFHENIYIREIDVENLVPEEREVRLFFGQNFSISGNSVGDTAAFDPETGGVVHYKGARYFLANATVKGGDGIAQFAVGQRDHDGLEGTFRDAEDGSLSGNAIAQGSVDSVLSVTLSLPGMANGHASYWIAAGESWKEVRSLDGRVRHKSGEELVKRTADYWRLWVLKESPLLTELPKRIGELYRRSLLVLQTQIDDEGGIVAANDSDAVLFNRDTYSYVWPRDGALTAHALDLAGYPAVAQNFYRFIARHVEPEGYLLHKYNPDGTPASSWHPWYARGERQLPIQEDETALVIWALWHHFVLYRDIDFMKPLYRPLIKNAADFMCLYREASTGLPTPSYDLWEERRGIHSFTVGAVFGGLTAASLFCTVFGETERAEHYRQVAADLRDAATRHLWRPELGRFCRMLTADNGGFTVDDTVDVSLWGLFAFGLYSAEDPRIAATFASIRKKLWLSTASGGLARYEGDYFYRVSADLPGNPWFVGTLWLADYEISHGSSDRELTAALDLLGWVTDHALPSGVLPEQVHPFHGTPLSVSPLTWSHATYVMTIQHLLRHLARMKECPTCGLSPAPDGRREDWLEKMFGQSCNAIHGICQIS
jgi:GH15 family glucan-1,4-alpha-glucosidase